MELCAILLYDIEKALTLCDHFSIRQQPRRHGQILTSTYKLGISYYNQHLLKHGKEA